MITFLPAIIFLSPLVLLFIIHFFWKKIVTTGRRNPLTHQLLRSPGESLREKIDDISFDADTYLVSLFCLPIYFYASYITQLYFDKPKTTTFISFIYISLIIAVWIFILIKFLRLIRLRLDYRLGLDGEMAVGQELNQLMFDEYKVYHDFQVTEKGFNIDHVVIGPAGVFAVETKTRAKKESKDKAVDAKVIFDGHALKFPGWHTKEPIDQAKSQAKWLSEWLNKAVGENVHVRPVLAIPGWYIKLEQSSDIFVYNGETPQNLIKGSKVVLSDVLIQRISHCIEERCRNIAPRAYKKEETKQ